MRKWVDKNPSFSLDDYRFIRLTYLVCLFSPRRPLNNQTDIHYNYTHECSFIITLSHFCLILSILWWTFLKLKFAPFSFSFLFVRCCCPGWFCGHWARPGSTWSPTRASCRWTTCRSTSRSHQPASILRLPNFLSINNSFFWRQVDYHHIDRCKKCRF